MNRPGFVGDLGVCCRRTRSDREAPDAEFQTRSALAVAPALWLAFLSSSRNSPEIWLVEAVMSGAGYGRLAKVGSGDPIGVTWWPLHQLDPVAVGVMEP